MPTNGTFTTPFEFQNLVPYNPWYAEPATYDALSPDLSNGAISNVRLLTHNDLDKVCHKIYKIITEHVQLDISEEEFMNILNND